MYSAKQQNILVWLPSPMGDAILSTPALRTLRQHFKNSKITFFCNATVKEILSPAIFNNDWIVQKGKNPLRIARILKKLKFSQVILLKNSFASALACFLAQIPVRIGYAREGRSIFLTEKLHPPTLAGGKFKPFPMTDYYLTAVSRLGCNSEDKSLELPLDFIETSKLKRKFSFLTAPAGPVIIMVPGGAFGPSKCWPTERFAQTADRLISKHNATIVISVSHNPAEKRIAYDICGQSRYRLVNLAESPLTIGQLKALFSMADLVITNDTGPRHIAIAFKRNVITLFGPNDPAWTATGWHNEITITGSADCAPCERPKCKQARLLCMESITVDMVIEAAEKFLLK